MRKKGNVELRITISEAQDKWLRKFCKTHGTTPSKWISFLLVKKTEELAAYLRWEKHPEQTNEELEEMIRIAKTPWIDEDE